MEYIINTENLQVGYGKKIILDNIDIKALKGQVICLLGANGAGKTTVLRTLSSLLSPVSGAVYIANENIKKIPKKQLAKKLSVVLTENITPSLMTCFDFVSLGRTPYTGIMGNLTGNDKTAIINALALVNAENLCERLFSTLSDGEKQKIMIARAIVQEPEIIILDEPTSHLDIKHKIEVIKIINKLSKEKNITCILSLHDIDLALKGCETILLVNDNKISACGSPEEIVKNGEINKLYKITDGSYNEILGSVEFLGEKGNDIFIFGGGATAVQTYRFLSRSRFALTTGVLHNNDVDYFVANSICSSVVFQNAFEDISDDNATLAKKIASEAEFIIDSGFPIAKINEKNIEMLIDFAENGRLIFSLRADKTILPNLENVIYCNNLSDLHSNLHKYKK